MTGKEYLLSLSRDKIFERFYEDYYKEDIIFNGKCDKDNIDSKSRKEMVKLGFLKAYNDIEKTIPQTIDNKYMLFPSTFIDYELEDDLTYKIYEDVDICLLEISSIKDVGKKNYITSTDEISTNFLFETYSLMFVSWEEILGCEMLYIPEEKDTYKVAAYLIHEMTWFGYDKETIEKNEAEEKRKLEEAVEELKDPSKCKTFSMDDLYEEFGFEKPSKEEDELREKLSKEVVITSYNRKIDIYNKYIVGRQF